MNSDEPSVILFPGQRHCCGCGKEFIGEGSYCCRACRAFVAYALEWYELQVMLKTARWAGASREEYLDNRMWAAVRRLPHDVELLAEVLTEIIEIAEEADEPE